MKQIVSGYVPLIPFKKIKWDDGAGAPDDESSYDTDATETSTDNPQLMESPSPITHADPSKTATTKNHTPRANSDKESKNSSSKNDDNSGKQKLGGGSTGVVFRGKYGKQAVAVKELTRLDRKSEMSWTDLTLIFRESILNSSLAHPNIVKFIGASLTYNAFYLVYEYCEYGDLQQIVVENSHPENQKLTCIKQRYWYLIDICKGMMFLHENNFVHRDLKTANVVVTWSTKVKRYIGKICDFGVSRKLPKDQQQIQEVNNSLLSSEGSEVSRLLSQGGGAYKGTGTGSNLGVPGDFSKSPTSDENSITGYEASATTLSAGM